MKRAIFLLATIGAAILLATGTVAVAQTTDPEKARDAEKTTDPENSQREVLRGVFHGRWGDPPRNSGAEPKTDYALVDDQGEATKLVLDRGDTDSKGGPLALKGKRVKVEGTRKSDKRLDVEKIDFERSEDVEKATSGGEAGALSAQALEGPASKPWVTIGCRFADSTGDPPKTKSYYEGLIGAVAASENPPELGMDDYWRELSFDKTNLAGSQVGRQNDPNVFWYNLPRPQSYYVPSSSNPDLDALAQECAAAADDDVKFTDFYGVNLVFDRHIGCCSWGGDVTLT